MTALDAIGAVVRGDLTDWPDASTPSFEAEFLAAAIEHSVEALIVWQLRRAGTFTRWPDSIREPLDRILREEVLLEVGREGELGRVVAGLHAAGVPCLLLKGAALAYSRYPEPWLRPRNDNDLLVQTADADAAGRVLTALGYEAGNVLLGEFVSYQAPYYKVDALGLRHAVDLHWKISNRPALADILSFDELSTDAIDVPALGAAARAPGDVRALLLACMHPVIHHHNSDNLLWSYDIHLLASRLGPAGFDALVTLARDRQLAAICASGLTRAVRHFHTAVPPSAMEQLEAAINEAPAAYLGRGPWRGDVRLSDLKSLVGWRARLRLIREVAFPSGDFMLREYRRTNRLLLPALHAHRLARGSWRLLRRFGQ